MSLSDLSLGSFLDRLGADSPAPGGGSAAALVGAAAAALCAMVCRLTLARDSSRDSWPSMKDALSEAVSMGVRLRTLIQEDADAYLSVVAARGLPRGTTEEKGARAAALQAATVRSAEVPLETLERLRACARLVELAASKGAPGCITDAGTAGALVRAGATAAAYNVRINLPSVTDESLRGTLDARTREALADIGAAADRIAREVEYRLDERSAQ
jgi:glutamate formiminotransferase/formiminotetrahydrofolate cyclodeaminase